MRCVGISRRIERVVNREEAPDLRRSDCFALGLRRRLEAFDQFLARIEHGVLAVFILGSVAFGVLSFAVRLVGSSGMAWWVVLPRYLTLGIGLVGASLATREGSHLALDLVGRWVVPAVQRWTRLVGATVGWGVATVLTYAAWGFVRIEQESAAVVLEGIPAWIPPTLLVWGFGLSAFRFLVKTGSEFPWALVVTPFVPIAIAAWADSAGFGAFAWFALAAGVVAGMPLFTALGGVTLLFYWNEGVDLAVVAIDIYKLAQAPLFVTLPLFTLAGTILAKGKAPDRLVIAARACLGWVPGGLVMATVMVCAFFTTFTGASGVTILALGALLHQLLRQEQVSDRLAVGLVTASGSIGLLFAPALPLIVYGIVAQVEIERMFIAGLIPGLLLVAAVATMAWVLAARSGALRRKPFSARSAARALHGASWELLLPFLVLGLFLAGQATIVEASALGAAYALLVSVGVRRDLPTFSSVREVLAESGVLIGVVLVILGVATAFNGYLVDAEIPQRVVEMARSRLDNRYALLLAINVLLLVVGCVLDIFSAIIIFVPLLLPVALAFDINPVHLGIVFLANLELGYLTPPVGMNLFLASIVYRRPLPEIWRTVLPFLAVLLAMVLLLTYVPLISLLWISPG